MLTIVMERIYIHRELEEEIEPFLKRKEILAIVGARQVGKTTFLRHIARELRKTNKVEFLTFEKESDLSSFGNIEEFKTYYKDFDVVIIDEFHYAENGGKKLKYLYDTTETKFIVSGSSSLELTFETGRYLVGRMLNFDLHPFSFREFLSLNDKRLFSLVNLRFKGVFNINFDLRKSLSEEMNFRLRGYFEKYLIFGGYPAVVLAKTQREKVKILENILEKYLLKDKKALLKLKISRELLTISKFLAIQIGELLNYKELSNSSGLLYKDVLKHLEVLESTFIINLIRPYFINSRTELVKTPKVYFEDLGFRNYLLSNFIDFAKRSDNGRMVENFVFSALRKSELLRKINFWRTKSKAEVDFLIQKDGQIIPIEVKYSAKPTVGKSLHSFIKKFSPPVVFIFTKGYSGEQKIRKSVVKFIPVYYL